MPVNLGSHKEEVEYVVNAENYHNDQDNNRIFHKDIPPAVLSAAAVPTSADVAAAAYAYPGRFCSEFPSSLPPPSPSPFFPPSSPSSSPSPSSSSPPSATHDTARYPPSPPSPWPASVAGFLVSGEQSRSHPVSAAAAAANIV